MTKHRPLIRMTEVSSHPPITSWEGGCMWDFDDSDEDEMDDFIVFLRAKR